MNILENVRVGDWICCDHAQPDLRCTQVVKRTPRKVWTTASDCFRLDGLRHRGDTYPIRPATDEDLSRWEEAKARAIARREQAELDRQESQRKWRIQNESEAMLEVCKLAAIGGHSPTCLTHRAKACDCHVKAAIKVLERLKGDVCVTGNITIVRASWCVMCGRIAFETNFTRKRYIVSISNGMEIAQVEGDLRYAWEHTTALTWRRVSREVVLEIIRQDDAAMWDWPRFMATWEAWDDGWRKARDEFDKRQN